MFNIKSQQNIVEFWKPSKTQQNPAKPNHNLNVNVYDNDNDNVDVDVNVNVNVNVDDKWDDGLCEKVCYFCWCEIVGVSSSTTFLIFLV